MSIEWGKFGWPQIVPKTGGFPDAEQIAEKECYIAIGTESSHAPYAGPRGIAETTLLGGFLPEDRFSRTPVFHTF